MDKDPYLFIFIIQVLTLKLTYEKGAKINDVITKHRNQVNLFYNAKIYYINMIFFYRGI